MYKLIATDCDGTILDSQGYLPKPVIETFRALNNKGIHIIIATGRNDILAKDYLDELNINCPVIGCNGATMVNFYTNTRYFINSMSKASLDKIFELCSIENIGVKAFTPDTCYTNNEILLKGGMGLIVKGYKKKLTYSIDYKYVEDMHSVSNLPNFIKAVVIENDIEKLLFLRDKINAQIPEVKSAQSNWNCIDINSANVSKGNAVLEYAKLLKIKPEEIIAFGDSENDISMLQSAGLGAAVENADDIVKTGANKIIESNDNFGVAKFLKSIYNL